MTEGGGHEEDIGHDQETRLAQEVKDSREGRPCKEAAIEKQELEDNGVDHEAQVEHL